MEVGFSVCMSAYLSVLPAPRWHYLFMLKKQYERVRYIFAKVSVYSFS